jgi:glycosyltransferase involved in cell wall biosynthesis
MTFIPEFSYPVITLLSISALCAAIILAFYDPFVRRVYRRSRACRLTVDRPAGEEPKWAAVSVIIYARGESDRLETLLPAVLTQQYEGPFEVIVVNEGDSSDVRNVISALQLANRNLYLTFTPDGARNLSRKKLALTLGIKAARYPVVVQTTADAVILSDRWLTKIMRHFGNPETGIVIGYAAPSQESLPDRIKTFDFADDSTSWLAADTGRRPFRGSELNLAYRRDLFFGNKGFSRSLNLHFGDDDIFISEIATSRNTVVELSPESIIRFSSYDMPSTLRDIAARHIFTKRFIPRKPLPRLAIGECALWILLLSATAAVLADYHNIATIVIAALLLTGPLVDMALAWRKTTAALDLRRLTLTIPWFVLIHPFRRITLSFYANTSKQKKYTWD